MKKTLLFSAIFILFAIGNTPSWGIGDNRMRIKMDKTKLKNAGQIAIVAFTGNSIVTGNMGLGSLVTGALGNKSESNKMSLDEAFMDEIYDNFTNTMSNEGYHFVATDKIVKSPSYNHATELSMTSFKSAKGLKNINADKAADLQAIATESGADLLFHVTTGHSLGMRGNIGTIVGKQVGIASMMIVVYDKNGKKLGFIDASDTSDSRAGAVAGGFSDPNKVLPMLKEADVKLIGAMAASLSVR